MHISQPALPQRRSLAQSFSVQMRVIGALMIREAMSRYGHESLGFFWLMGEPLLLTSGVTVLWSLTRQTHGAGVDVIPFALTGYSMLTLWRQMVFRSMGSLHRNVGLVFHANIKFLDVLVARAMLDTIGILAAFFIAYVPLVLFGYIYPIRDPLLLFGGWFLTAWFSFGVGLIVAALSEISDTIERFVHPIMYITLPITGAFYMVYWLPEKIRYIMLWSPLVHGSEMFRSGIFPVDVPTIFDPLYLFWWCVGLTAVGLPCALLAQHYVRHQ
jgi:capsular polysaccharide transport system permease protein